MLTATRIRLYPTDRQAQALAVQFGCARWTWNEALAESGALYH
jgi:putative transposase